MQYMITKYKLFENKNEEMKMFPELCSYFIEEIKSVFPIEDFLPLYRGFQKNITNISKNTLILNSKLKDREPLHTSKKYHNLFNKYFLEVFGWKARNGVFVTSKRSDASRYGKPHLFFPIGKYKYTYSTLITDLFGELDYIDDDVMSDLLDHFKGKVKGDVQDYVINYVSNGGKLYNKFYEESVRNRVWEVYRDEDLKSALINGCEISFKCDKYFLFPDTMLEEIIDIIYA